MKPNDRLQAIKILCKLLQDKTPLYHLLRREHSSLIKEICFGFCRYYFKLEAIADSLLKTRPKALEIWVSILIGLYQLRYLHIPDYAVVKETVDTLLLLKKPWGRGLVNAVLRNYCRQQGELEPKLLQNDAYRYNHPAWLVERLRKDWPNHWQSILQANDSHPPMSLRINCRQTNQAEYLKHLAAKDIEALTHPWSDCGIVLGKPCEVNELPGFSEGMVSVQDIAAQLAAPLLNLKPHFRVLDACAAPGGKTCHIAESEPRLLELVALDIDEKRLERVRENLQRLGLKATVTQGDAVKPETWWDGQYFDRILLDAPCSATGVIRRNPDIKLLRKASDITAVAKRQYDLLRALWPLLASGGQMVYATCSVIPEENEEQIAQFVKDTKDCLYVEQKLPFGMVTGHGWQILPGQDNMDGFFYSVLAKK